MFSKKAGDKLMQIEIPEMKTSHSIKPKPAFEMEDIAAKLREIYAEVASQPVPDHLLELVRELEAKDGKPRSR